MLWEDTQALYDSIGGTDITVGDNPDVTLNPSCGVSVVAAGIFKCDLFGKFIGLIKPGGGTIRMCEFQAFPWDNIEATGTASLIG